VLHVPPTAALWSLTNRLVSRISAVRLCAFISLSTENPVPQLQLSDRETNGTHLVTEQKKA